MKMHPLTIILSLFAFSNCNQGTRKAVYHSAPIRVGVANGGNVRTDSVHIYCVNLTDDTLRVSDPKYLANVYPTLFDLTGKRITPLIKVKLNTGLRDSLIALGPNDSIVRVHQILLSKLYDIHSDSSYLIEASFMGKIYSHGRFIYSLADQVKTRIE